MSSYSKCLCRSLNFDTHWSRALCMPSTEILERATGSEHAMESFMWGANALWTELIACSVHLDDVLHRLWRRRSWIAHDCNMLYSSLHTVTAVPLSAIFSVTDMSSKGYPRSQHAQTNVSVQMRRRVWRHLCGATWEMRCSSVSLSPSAAECTRETHPSFP